MKSKPHKQKIDDYTRERCEWLLDTSVSTVVARIRARKKKRA